MQDRPSPRRAFTLAILGAALGAIVVLLTTRIAPPPPRVNSVYLATDCSVPCETAYSMLVTDVDTYSATDPNHRREYTGKLPQLGADVQRLLQAALNDRLPDSPRPYPVRNESMHQARQTSMYIQTHGGTPRTFYLVVGDPNAPATNQIIMDVYRKVYTDVERQRRITERGIRAYGNLREIVLETSPFFWCGRFHMVLKRAGESWAMPSSFPEVPERVRLGTEPFTLAVAVLNQESADTLLEDYPFHTRDAASLKLTLRYRTFTYSVDAPDQSQWPPELSRILARLEEIAIERAHPSAPMTKCMRKRF